MSDRYMVRMGNGEEHVVNQQEFDAILAAEDDGVRFVNLKNELVINIAFIEKMWKVKEDKGTFKDEYLRDDRAAPESLARAREKLDKILDINRMDKEDD